MNQISFSAFAQHAQQSSPRDVNPNVPASGGPLASAAGGPGVCAIKKPRRKPRPVDQIPLPLDSALVSYCLGKCGLRSVVVVLDGRRYRVQYHSDGSAGEVFVCDVRMRERGQPKGAWKLDGERRIPKNGPTARAAIAKATGSAA